MYPFHHFCSYIYSPSALQPLPVRLYISPSWNNFSYSLPPVSSTPMDCRYRHKSPNLPQTQIIFLFLFLFLKFCFSQVFYSNYCQYFSSPIFWQYIQMNFSPNEWYFFWQGLQHNSPWEVLYSLH